MTRTENDTWDLATSVGATAGAAQIQQAATQRWYEHGLDVRLDDLSYHGEHHDVAGYLGARGWQTTRTQLSQLLADSGLPPPPRKDGEASLADNYYCTATR